MTTSQKLSQYNFHHMVLAAKYMLKDQGKMNYREQELIAHYDQHLHYACPIKTHHKQIVRLLDIDKSRMNPGLSVEGLMCDLGCGTGEWVAQACSPSIGYDCFGVDYSPERIKKAKATRPDLSFFQMRVQDAARSFIGVDYWTMWDVLEHLEDPESLIASLKGVAAWASVPINMDYVAHIQLFKDLSDVADRLKPTKLVPWECGGQPYALMEWKLER